MMSIEIKGITKSYGTQKAVDNISLSLRSGEIIGFLGPNGAGKTTTMKIITGLISSDMGKVYILGKDINDNPIECRKHIGYLPESNPLYSEMYIREYLKYVADIYMPNNKNIEIVNNAISITGLSKEQHKKIHQLSKGYKQRVGLAQALIHNPDILILDEPTTGLDPNQISEIRELIREVGKDKTVLLSTHIMQEVEAICDRVIIINEGKIVADDIVENIINHYNGTLTSVEFTSPIDLCKINKIQNVKNTKKISNNKYLITSSKDIRKELFLLAVKNNYTIIELKHHHENLDSIFRKLTN